MEESEKVENRGAAALQTVQKKNTGLNITLLYKC